MIRFENVDVVYPGGFQGLKNVSLAVEKGEFVVIVGLSGAGKSTLIRTINGLVPYTSGTLTVGGDVVDAGSRRGLRRLRSRVGMIFQSFNLVTRISVLSNVLVGRSSQTSSWRSLLGWYKPQDKEIAFRSLERVGIVEKAYVRASTLSGGQQQRVAIARVLAQDPEVILADEPVASLDPPTAHKVLQDLRRINRELGITTIVNLHHLDMARRYADRVIGMRGGEVVFDGPVEEATDVAIEAVYQRSLTAEDVVVDGSPVESAGR
ncbi:phosphonate ABC transporter ATP-binding protein [Nesterenkonia xinjiangensis]|uniref:Phosphonate transport system ATP-binding protein n=1 Tax=Nesterenkonia xinjiangensis TaxID=225327 RepID=A0A7Z0K950_9MICC|nr:phosphonate ABC transporter ATP-binding protein [Nesterenkonia xinjiangensis]NYJ78379.1 phosphonate transport system ATP-binding protein [Nesterenkonia xinjiangensis]